MPPPSPGPLPDPGQLTSQHVRRAVDGDAASMSWLIERLNPLLIAQARWRMGTALKRVCEPADLVHEAWLVLLPRLDTLPPRDGRMTPVLLSFLSTTILHKTQNLLRREARRRLQTGSAGDGDDPLLELGGPQSEVVSAVVRREAETQIRTALEELNNQDREILLMRGIEQQETEAVMELLRLSRDAVYKRYARALTRLRERFPNSVFDELRDE